MFSFTESKPKRTKRTRRKGLEVEFVSMGDSSFREGIKSKKIYININSSEVETKMESQREFREEGEEEKRLFVIRCSFINLSRKRGAVGGNCFVSLIFDFGALAGRTNYCRSALRHVAR